MNLITLNRQRNSINLALAALDITATDAALDGNQPLYDTCNNIASEKIALLNRLPNPWNPIKWFSNPS